MNNKQKIQKLREEGATLSEVIKRAAKMGLTKRTAQQYYYSNNNTETTTEAPFKATIGFMKDAYGIELNPYLVDQIITLGTVEAKYYGGN